MKKTMYGLGIAIPIILGVAVVFKFQHWPGAGALFSLGLFAMAVVFIPIFAIVRIRDTRQQNEPVPLGFYLTGMIASMLTILGSLLKVQHMPGAGPALSLGLVTMAFAVLPMFAVLKIREARANGKIVNLPYYILGVLAGALFLTGGLFKIMHWPGGGIVITISWLAVAIILLPLLVISILKQEGNRLNNFLLIILAFSVIAILLLAQLNRPTKIKIDGFVTTEINLATKVGYLKSKSDRIIEEVSLAGQNEAINIMQSIHSEADEACNLMRTLQEDMILFVNKENKEAIQMDGNIDYSVVTGKDNDYPSLVIMLGKEGSEANATIVKSRLESFMENALIATGDPELKLFINSQLDFFIVELWEELYFDGIMIQSLTYLTMFQSTVRTIEYQVLNELNQRIEE